MDAKTKGRRGGRPGPASDKHSTHAQHSARIPLFQRGYAWLREPDRGRERGLDAILRQVARFRLADPELARQFAGLLAAEHAKRSSRGRWVGVVARVLSRNGAPNGHA